MMAGSDTAPSKGRMQKRKTNPLQIVKSSLQRTAGPYKSAIAELHRLRDLGEVVATDSTTDRRCDLRSHRPSLDDHPKCFSLAFGH
jgi:hypothetical protein